MNQIEEYYYNQIKSDSESENEESKEEISKNEEKINEKINEKEENINKEKKKNELIKIPTIKMRKKAKSVQKKYKIFSIYLKKRILNEVK
jgi:hypothetical protein